jgi:hypothetical protein
MNLIMIGVCVFSAAYGGLVLLAWIMSRKNPWRTR